MKKNENRGWGTPQSSFFPNILCDLTEYKSSMRERGFTLSFSWCCVDFCQCVEKNGRKKTFG